MPLQADLLSTDEVIGEVRLGEMSFADCPHHTVSALQCLAGLGLAATLITCVRTDD